jgi:tripartite-type tricarboxylate transporter receptor subunit TctC
LSSFARHIVPLCVAAALAMVLPSALADAHDWPQQRVTILAPYPAGGVIDMTARVVGEALRQSSGQQVIINNRVGGNGLVALGELKRSSSTPDGTTLLVNNDGGLALPPALDPAFNLDPYKDYTPIAQVNQFTWVFLVNAALPVQTLAEFIAYAKQRPGEINYASPGNGSVPHLATEQFARLTGLKLTHIPYKGGAPAMADVMAGVIPMSIVSAQSAIGQLGSERIRMLAVLGPQRLPQLPNVPTMAEAGVDNFVVVSWNAFFGPPEMPRDLVNEISRTLVSAVETPAVRKGYENALLEPVAKDADTFTRIYYGDVKRWKAFAAENNFRLNQ